MQLKGNGHAWKMFVIKECHCWGILPCEEEIAAFEIKKLYKRKGRKSLILWGNFIKVLEGILDSLEIMDFYRPGNSNNCP